MSGVPANWYSLCFDLVLGGPVVSGLTHGACLKLTISKLLGYLIIAGSCIVKVPQILKFYRAGEAKGVNVNMYILETIGYSITVAFNIRKGFPFSTYGENSFIWVQNIILIAMMYHYAKAINLKFAALVAVYAAFFFALFSGVLSDEQMTLCQAATLPVFASSKLPQIWTSYRNKSTGQLAFVTCFMNFAGVLARVFTTFTEVPDPILKMGVLSALFFNGIVVAQFFLYRSATPKAKEVTVGTDGTTTTTGTKTD